jgi:MscS family membrane protein
MKHFLLRVFPLFCVCVVSVATLADGGAAESRVESRAESRGWAGAWDTAWSDGGGRLVLEQTGDTITGRYPQRGVRIEARASGDQLQGRWFDGDHSDSFVVVLSRDGQSFTGRDDRYGWWSGMRAKTSGSAQTLSCATPRDVFVNFVAAANRARDGDEDSWGTAAQAIEFDAAAAPEPRTVQLRRIRELFNVMDLTTFRTWEVATDEPSGVLTLELQQPRSDAVLKLTIRRDGAGQWHIVMPSTDQLVASRKALVAGFGANPPTGQSFKSLQSARDAMRSFLMGSADWDGEGKTLALSTLDLSRFPETLRDTDSELVAGYLFRTLQAINFNGLQSLPNNSSSRDPATVFRHQHGSIVLAPTGPEAGAPWKFTPQTVEQISELYFATSQLPPSTMIQSPRGWVPSATYFRLRQFVSDHAPFLLGRVKRIEVWQLLVVLVVIPITMFSARLLSLLACRLLARIPGVAATQPRWFSWSATVLIFAMVLRTLPMLLGIPERAREFTIPYIGTLVTISGAVVAWHGVTLLSALLMKFAMRTATTTDELTLNLLRACLRVAICVVAAFGIAYFFAVPASNMLAGLGIGGLAVALASRATLANFFGAGILVADRPFRSGDWIRSQMAEGVVEAVGIRSTRVRTTQGDVIIVPNGNLADATIVNQGIRNHRLMNIQLTVVDGASPSKLEQFIEAVRARVQNDPAFIPQETSVGVIGILATGVQLQINGALSVNSDDAEFQAKHVFLVDVMRTADQIGLSLGKGFVRE